MNEQERFEAWWNERGINSILLRSMALTAWMVRAELKDPTPPANQPDPDEWVVQDRVPVRVGIEKKTTDDFGMYLESVIAKDPQLKAEVDAAEAELAAIDARLNEPQPARRRVRLWLEGPTKMVMCRDKAPYGDWQEIHHDAEGFYVEESR